MDGWRRKEQQKAQTNVWVLHVLQVQGGLGFEHFCNAEKSVVVGALEWAVVPIIGRRGRRIGEKR